MYLCACYTNTNSNLGVLLLHLSDLKIDTVKNSHCLIGDRIKDIENVRLVITLCVGTNKKTKLCGTDGQSRNDTCGTTKKKKNITWHVPEPVTYASVVKSKRIEKVKSEVVDHQRNEIKSKLILLSQSNS